MNAKTNSSKKPITRVLLCILSAAILLAAGIGIGYGIRPEPEAPQQTGYVSNPA